MSRASLTSPSIPAPAEVGRDLGRPGPPAPASPRRARLIALTLIGLAILAAGQYLFDEDLQAWFEKLPALQWLRQPLFQRQGPAIVAVLVGALLAATALRRFVPPLEVELAGAPPRPPAPRRRLAWAALALAVAVTAALVIDILITPFKEYRPWVLLAAVLLGGGGCALLGRGEPGQRLRVGVADLAWMAAGTAFFIVANAPTLTDPRFGIIGDEYAFWQVAYSLAAGAPVDLFTQNAVYGVHTSFSSWLQALTMRLFGLDHFGWKMSGVLLGALAIPPTYLTGLWLFGRTTARLAAAVVATSHLLFAYAHSGQNNIDSVLPEMLTLCLLVYALRRPSPLAWFLAGAAAGSSLYFFFGARVAGPLLAAGMLARGWRPLVRGLAPAALGCAIVIAPFVARTQAAVVTSMLDQGVAARESGSLVDAIRTSAISTAWSHLLFHYTTARSQHFVSLGFLDPFSAALSTLGLCVALLTLR
ncbi:MAG TPA: glycosyltransferase family 39 protein, partial [Chloroflexota bacterium]